MNLDKVMEVGVEIDRINVSVDYKDISFIHRIVNSYN